MSLTCERLVEDHLDALHGLAQAWTRDPELARELVQRTFLRAFEKRDQLRDAKAARSWLITIFRNEWAGERRARCRFEVWDNDAFEALPQDPGEDLLDPADLERLPEALERLPETTRRLLLLRFQQELSYEQIAEVLDVPAGTVMSRLHRAKAALRKLLRPRTASGEAQA
jgi:RNA polymerase sigma-70 factor (ECF subfamily)